MFLFSCVHLITSLAARDFEALERKLVVWFRIWMWASFFDIIVSGGVLLLGLIHKYFLNLRGFRDPIVTRARSQLTSPVHWPLSFHFVSPDRIWLLSLGRCQPSFLVG